MMVRFTEKIGDQELTYEADTFEDVVRLKNAINPSILRASAPEHNSISSWKSAPVCSDEIRRTPAPPGR